MNESSSAPGAGGLALSSKMPSTAGGSSANLSPGGIGSSVPLDFNQKRFSLGASKGAGSGQPDPTPAMQWANSMLMTWIRQSNEQSQQWVQAIAEDSDND